MDAARLQQLVAETAWLRRLARSLVSDAATADDVVQETYLVAAERAPDDRPIEPWLARVARNLARMRGRSEARRSARELATGDHADTPARPDQLVERVETQRLLTNFVLELGEPYRDVILLHFFEGLSSAAIARRLGIPDGTVRWRLKHALDDLRARLDAREDRKAWLAPMAALAHTATPVAGVLVMKKLIAIAIALILIAMLVVVVYRHGDRAEDPNAPGNGSTLGGTIVVATAVPGWVVQAEIPSRRIAGRVVFAGAPVAKAAVALRAAAQPDVAIADAVTDADGTFAFASPPPADYLVIASSVGRSPAIVDVNTNDPHAHPDQLLLELGACRSRAFGIVSDASSTPIAKARLRVRGLVGVDTGVDGRYDLCLPPSRSTMTVGADGYGTLTASFDREGVQHRDFMLVPEGVLVGRVVHADRESVVADAQVIAISADNARDMTTQPIVLTPVSTRSDGEGRFQISGLAPGRFHVSATSPGLGSAIVETIVQAGKTDEIVVVMSERSRIRGHVTAGGEPVAGARVSVIGASNLAPAAPVWSQSDGSFVVVGAPRGIVRWSVLAYDVASPASTVVDKAELTGVVIEVHRGAEIRGHVTQHGSPVAGAEVHFGHMDWSHGLGFDEHTTRSDSTGAYVLGGVEIGHSSVVASNDVAYSDPHEVEITAGSTTTVDFDLYASASVSGVVVDETGAPVPSVAVALGDEAAVITNIAGEFRVREMSAGDFVPRVYPQGTVGVASFAPASGTAFSPIHVPDPSVSIADVRLAIRLERLTISGTVVDDRGTPLPDVRVTISDAVGAHDQETSQLRLSLLPVTMQGNPAVLSWLPTTVTDGAGGFVLHDLAGGRYVVLATAADGANVQRPNVEAGATNVTVTLRRSGSIDGVLLGFGPTPEVMATNGSDNIRAAAVDGTRFTIIGLHPGTYAVTAKDAAGAEARTVEVTSGTSSHVELHAGGTGRIEGRIVNLTSGEPLVTRCMASPGSTGLASWWNFDAAVMSDASGHFAIDPAPAGRTRVICMGDARAQRDVIVPAGGTVQTELASVPLAAKGGLAGFTMLEDQSPPTVFAIQPKGAAAMAGLAIGDQVLSVDGIAYDSIGVDGVAALLDNHAPGSAAVLVVLRGGAARTITLVLR